MNRYFTFLILLLGLSCSRPNASREYQSPDLLIKGGLVYTGNEEEGKVMDVVLSGDRILYVGPDYTEVNDSTRVIDASGMVVAPGFIDPHTHALEDLNTRGLSHNLPFLHQGITTVITGSDGRSPIPITSSFEQWEKLGIGTNALMLVGHGQVRLNVIGDDDRAPTEDELQEMKLLVRTAMEDGAYGISTGLFYSPGFFATTEEVIELSKVVASYDGIYDTHQRDESSYTIGLVNSVKEVIRIGREANIPVHISHIKALGADVWGKSSEIIQMINEAREEGIEVTANQYPYVASGTSMAAATLPRSVSDGGAAAMMARLNDQAFLPELKKQMKANIARRGGGSSLLLINPAVASWKNKTLTDLAREWQMDEVEAALTVIREGGSGVASFNMKESDIVNFMKEPWVVTGSDGSLNHPRKYGTFPRKIRKYVLEDSVLTMGRAIMQSTARTAQLLRLRERGELKAGYFADLVIFNPEIIRDRAWFTNPDDLSEGIEYVIVNGEVAIEQGNYLGNYPGRILRKNQENL